MTRRGGSDDAERPGRPPRRRGRGPDGPPPEQATSRIDPTRRLDQPPPPGRPAAPRGPGRPYEQPTEHVRYDDRPRYSPPGRDRGGDRRYDEYGQRYDDRYDERDYGARGPRGGRYEDAPYEQRYDEERYEEWGPEQRPAELAGAAASAAAAAGAAVPPGPDGIHTPRKMTVTRVAAARTSYLSKQLVHKIGDASKAQGAGESGLTHLIWLNAVNMAADAMIAVCLAGTIFFSAATSQQRGNVALYLLITMAPFALVAPVIGPVLDRLHRGRRWALGGTMLARALLAYVMAANFHSFGLYPAAFGTLVLAKAYGVLRAAAVPRVLPGQLTLVSANARLSIFGLGAAAVAGGLLAGFIRLSGSYPWALRITMVVFLAGAVLAVRLPKHVDSPDDGQAPEKLTISFRSQHQFSAEITNALWASSALRGLSGFLTLFMVFLVGSHATGLTAALELGAVVGGAGIGSFLGTAAGARLPLTRPDAVVRIALASAAGVCVVTAIAYSIQTAALVGLVTGAANSLGKLALDAIIQRDVPEHLTASAFGRTETVLQLAWVLGGGLGIALPSNGRVGFPVVAVLLVGVFVLTVAMRRNGGTLPRPADPRLSRFGKSGSSKQPQQP